jgi:NADPH:quinone reductase-like Zn-dependent oxidoreductase/SAM-dependent methyltransferase/NADP-dependent 3-hydroxy acid dehydrogenase YdfG/acyl carrier protein
VVGQGHHRIPLPPYPWQRERHWFDPTPDLRSHRSQGVDTGHPLLGRRLRAARPTWESDLGEPRLSYLDGHVVHDRVVFPGAAYVEIALAAARELRGGGPLTIEHVELERLLPLPERNHCALQCLVDDRDSVEVHSSPNSEPLDWTRRATARLGPPTDAPHSVDLPAIKERCSNAVDVDTLYKLMEDGHGLRYTGAFRSIAELWRRDDEVLARIEPPAGIDLSLDGYHVHPALLDAALQSLALASAAVLPADGVVLPVSIRRVELYASPGARFWSHASVDHTTDGTQVKGAIRIVDDAGQLLLACHDVCLRVLAERSRESIEDWLYEERWEHEPSPGQVRAVPAASELATAVEPTLERLASESLGDYYATVEPALNALAVRYVAAGLHELGFDATIDVEATDALADRIGVIPRRRRYLTRLLQIARAGGASTPTDPLPVDEGRYGAAVELVRESGRRLAAMLRGEQDAREWLFRGESLDAVAQLYSVHPLFGVYNAAIAEAVMAVQQARSPSCLRVLEIGGGTGGTTAAVLHRLSDDALEYVFTDISSFFVRSAKERFRDRPRIHADTLDIEQPQAGTRTYDVVIAADVVHATTDVRTTLRNMHSLLVPGGLLVLLEAIRRSAWLDLVFGQLDGWWRFRDRDLRRENPLLGVREWERALVEANFADVCSLVDATGAGDPAQAVLLASERSDGHHSQSRAARRWLVLTDRQGAGVAVAAALRQRGDECVLVWKGAAYQRFGDDGVALSPTCAADWARLVDDQDRLDGVIHLWSLDAPDEPSVEELMAFQRLSTWTAVSLVQAFRATGRAVPDLWLVTVGAQVVGDEGNPTSVAQAPLWGLGRVLRNEQAGGRCRLVDLGPGCSPGDVEGLLAELDTNRADEVAFRAGRRYVRRIRRVNLEPTQRPKANLRLSPETASFGADVAEPGVLETLRLREMPKPVPGPGNVVIKTVAAGMNFRDVLLALDMPFVYGPNGESPPLGLECAGLVEACGEGVDGLRPGDEVIALAGGAFASRVEARAELVVPKPAQLTFGEAASIPVAYLTAEYALRRLARIAAGELVLIHSATGGVGLAALQVARRAGARIFATAGSPEKRAYLASLGVEHVWDSRSLAFADDILQVTGGDGVDVVLNSLTGAGMVTSLGTLRTHGRFVELGRRDFHENRPLGLQPFLKNLAFFAFDLQEVVRDRPHEVGQVLRSLVSRIEAGELAPLPHREFDLSDIEQAFRHMSQARHVGKVVLSVRRGSYPVCPRGRETIFNAAGSYLVTGGLGGFGLAVANWMVREGARHIVLASRSGLPATEDETALDALMSTAANIVVTRCDIANRNDVQRVIAQIRATMPPLKGVIHTAMVLDDGALERLDWPRFEAVLAPKVAGAWNLHELTRDDDLEWFVLFSSISALTGPPTQSSYAAANSFLGALAAHRRAEGRPAVAIDWGMISDVGYVARSPGLERRLTRYGLGTKGITADQACCAVEHIIRRGLTRVAVSRTNLTELSHEDAVDNAIATPRVEHKHGVARPSAISTSLVAVPAGDRPAMLEQYLVQRTAIVLDTAAERVDLDRPLPDMGFDSLMAVELRAAIQSDLHVEVPIVDMLESLNLRQLAAEVLHRMSSDGHDT